MDTRYWGPSAWRFLHLITFAYNPKTQKDDMRRFFELLPFVLPCKYCRAHLVDHYAALPLEDALRSQDAFSKWFYKIHGLVNETLRSEGSSIPPDPPYIMVKEIYEQRLAYGCSKTFFPGWEFLFSILETHPSKSESPLPNAPPKATIDPQNELQLLRWNHISPSSRLTYVCEFWTLLPKVLPFEEWRTLWMDQIKDSCDRTWKSKETAFRVVWKTRKAFEEKLDLLNRTSYHDLCKMIRYYKSGCASSQKRTTRTCRRLQTRKHKKE